MITQPVACSVDQCGATVSHYQVFTTAYRAMVGIPVCHLHYGIRDVLGDSVPTVNDAKALALQAATHYSKGMASAEGVVVTARIFEQYLNE
jgi:hypothetical protein